MSASPERFFTPEEYLALEIPAEHKSQYVGGEIFALAGAQPWHVEVVGNINAALLTRFCGRPCKTYSSEMRVRSKPGNLWTYPDEWPSVESRSSTPAETLRRCSIRRSSSRCFLPPTEAFDKGDKFRRYRQLEFLTDYVLVSSDRWRVEHHRVQPNGVWSCEEYSHQSSRFRLVSLDCELPLAEIYEGVTFPT